MSLMQAGNRAGSAGPRNWQTLGRSNRCALELQNLRLVRDANSGVR
jgi:hypothetical protein